MTDERPSTVDARPPIEPTLDITLEIAIEEMTGFEALGIEARFKRKLEEISGITLAMGVVWAYENRHAKTAWVVVEGMTIRQIQGYFQPDPEDPNADEPDSELGKEPSPAARAMPPLRTGALEPVSVQPSTTD